MTAPFKLESWSMSQTSRNRSAAPCRTERGAHYRRIPGFIKAHFIIKKIDEFVEHLFSFPGNFPKPSSGWFIDPRRPATGRVSCHRDPQQVERLPLAPGGGPPHLRFLLTIRENDLDTQAVGAALYEFGLVPHFRLLDDSARITGDSGEVER